MKEKIIKDIALDIAFMEVSVDVSKIDIAFESIVDRVKDYLQIEKPSAEEISNTGWIPIEEAQPKPQQKVYVVCENPKYGGGVVRFQTMAEYIPYMTVKDEDYMSDDYLGYGDYNEEEDEYYTPEGFYEWQSEADMNWKILAKVTHWMPLIALP
jgi:hypothetical protein